MSVSNDTEKRKMLLILEQCNPDGFSVPLVAYNIYAQLRKHFNVVLVTSETHKEHIEKVRNGHEIYYIKEGFISRSFRRLIYFFTRRSNFLWRLEQIATYPLYAGFNRKVNKMFGRKVKEGDFDIVQACTPMPPRYPYKIIKNCSETPFLLGPVNGGLPFPTQHKDIQKSELSFLNFIRKFNHLIPGYKRTYTDADHILFGSTNTMNALQQLFNLNKNKISLFFENGIPESFFNDKPLNLEKEKVELLFTGRLVRVKGTHLLIDALAKLPDSVKNRIHLTLVGDGTERENIIKQIETLGLSNYVTLTGWITHEETRAFYQKSDIFCFPSLREFGGAVVLEAMANKLPCIVVDYGGIGEYVTDKSGIKIPMGSGEEITTALSKTIEQLVTDKNLYLSLAEDAYKRATEFKWSNKGLHLAELINELCQKNMKK